MNRKITVAFAILLIIVVPVQAQSDEPPSQAMVHIVQGGETLFSIAQQYGLTVDAVTHANSVPDPRQIYVGQRLVMPGNKTKTSTTEMVPYIFQAGDTLASVARRYGTTWQIIAQNNNLLTPNAIYTGQIVHVPALNESLADAEITRLPSNEGVTYVVHPDDTLFRIALRYDISPQTLAAASHIANPALIYPGQELVAHGDGDSLLPEPFRSVEVQPLPVAQGTAMIVTVYATDPITLTGSLFEQEVRFGNEGDVYYGLVGVHVFTEPGLYDLELTAIDGRGQSTTIGTGVVVEAARFNFERIDVPASRTNLLDPIAIARDRERLDTARFTFTPERRWTVPFQRPCIGSISAYFGSHRSYNGGPYTSYHSGTDFRISGGTPVYAPAAGTVVLAEPLSLWGNALVIDHGWGVLTGYAHLSAFEVEVGQQVAQGELVAKVGNTGLSTGSHLHWEMWVGGISVNALDWLEESFPWPETYWIGIGG
ncbi:MAG: LysM peptidoglycan-binding domain-containing protein [Chloroflexi bacterium]|nr:LysM peptidoglycan-binding domain-containing protein [Chloroflexota bacterium]